MSEYGFDAETLQELLASIQANDSPIAIAPMTVDVAHHMVSVNRSQVRDPFDRAIVATAQAMGLPLLTKDGTLTRHFPQTLRLVTACSLLSRGRPSREQLPRPAAP